MIVVTRSVDETRALGEELARRVLRPGDLVVLDGELGAGKTALTQGIARGLGVTTRVTSPTFVIAREHDGPVPLVHLDAYRLAGPADLEDLGFDDLVRPDGVTVVEWGERVARALPGDRLEVRIGVVALAAGGDGVAPIGAEPPSGALDDERNLELVCVGAAWRDRAPLLDALAAAWPERERVGC